MPRSRFIELGLLLTCILLILPARGYGADGFVVSIRYQAKQMGNIHDSVRPGKLMRYEIKNNQVVGTRVLYDREEITGACISPFGDRIAITRVDGMIAVLPAEGGPQLDLVRFTGDEKPIKDAPAQTGLQWPSSEGGEWIYYLDGRQGGANNSLRRVRVTDKKDELVVRFNRSAWGAFALSPTATPNSGYFVKRTDNYVIAIYDLSRGNGDMYSCARTSGCGESISPDGALLTANDGSHTSVTLVDMAGQPRHSFRLSEWEGDPTRGKSRDKIEWAWQHFRWSVNAPNWIAVTQGKLKLGSTHEIYFADAMLYDWVNKTQINVTHNPTGTFDRPAGFWETGSRVHYLGSFTGKAPLTVEVKDRRLRGKVRWDFGDGTKTESEATRSHTYHKEGTYNLKAWQGDTAFQAQVLVQKRRPPTAQCRFISATCLRIDFDVPVQMTDLQVKLDSGAAVAETRLNETGRYLLVLLKEPLRRSDQLHLRGIRDTAQVPNALPDRPLPVELPAWPTNRADLVFLWENARACNALFDPKMNEIKELRVSRDAGMAGVDRHGRMRLEKGRLSTGFFSQANAQMQFRDLILADAFSLEATIQAADLTAKKSTFPARIVNCSAWYDTDWEFFLGQQEDRLMFSIRTTDNLLSMDGKRVKNDLHGRAPVYEIARLPDTLPHHVIVSYVPGRLVAYLDGKKVFETPEVIGSLKAWGYGELCFGDNHNGGRHQWSGRLEGVAIYKRFIEASEAAANAMVSLKKARARKELPQLEVQVQLRATSRIPELRQIAPYRDALVINEFEVESIVKQDKEWQFPGKIEPGQKIRVAQWGLVDGVASNLAQAKVGNRYRLLLEVYVNHPEKLDEMETSNSLQEDFETPLFYEPRP